MVGHPISSLILADPCHFVTGTKPDQWIQLCRNLATCLDEYSNTLLWSAQEFLRIGDGRSAEIVQSSCISCLAHLALLCNFAGHLEPNSKPKMDVVCDSSLGRLGCLTRVMHFDGYTYFDSLLRVCPHCPSLTVDKLIMLLVRFRGEGRWLPSIHGLIAYRTLRVHPSNTIEKLSEGRGQTSQPGFQADLPQHFLHSRRSSMVGKGDRDIRTLCWLRSKRGVG